MSDAATPDQPKPEQPTREWLESQIRSLGPWHHDIQLTDDLSTGQVFSDGGRLERSDNDGVSLISPRQWFVQRTGKLFPDGLSGKRFLDCACNAGAYCFFAREQDAEHVVGFDIRDHWINQAKFIQQHRTVAPTDRIDFSVQDVFELGQIGLQPFDLTFFCGIFYHLPDPIHGLKLAADLTKDILLVNTATMDDESNPTGLTPNRRPVEKSDEIVMSGVYNIAWYPNGPEAIYEILRWLGFEEMKLARKVKKEKGRGRIEIIAARSKGRLANAPGELMHP